MCKNNYMLKAVRFVAVWAAVLLCLLAATACNKQPNPDETEQQNPSAVQLPDSPSDQDEPQPTKTIANVEDMVWIEGVLSIEKLEFSNTIYGVVAYQVLCHAADGTQLAMEIILPDDYTDAATDYPVLFYCPQIGWSLDELAMLYARYGYIVIRPYKRGYGQSEGMRDLGGAGDISDAQTLLHICDSAGFLQNKKMFLLGSSEGATIALRLFAQDDARRFEGCAVVDVITDMHAYGEMRGESIMELQHRLIGNTYEEAPEEYELRSPLYFYERLDRPMLLLCYTQSPFISVESIDLFYERLCTVNPDVTYHKLDALSADFSHPGHSYLMSWLGDFNEND